MNCAFNAIQNVILIFPDERQVFLRELNNNMYSASAYFWSKVISELPVSILTPVLYGSMIYYSIGLHKPAEFFFNYLATLILVYNASGGYSMIISVAISNKQLAVTMTPMLIVPFMLFAGFFVSSDNIPWFLKEFEYLSIFKYGYQALVHNEFDYFMNTPGANDDPDVGFPCIDVKPGPNRSMLGKCNPLSQLAENSDCFSSQMALLGMYVGCYMISWFILVRLSKKYD